MSRKCQVVRQVEAAERQTLIRQFTVVEKGVHSPWKREDDALDSQKVRVILTHRLKPERRDVEVLESEGRIRN